MKGKECRVQLRAISTPCESERSRGKLGHELGEIMNFLEQSFGHRGCLLQLVRMADTGAVNLAHKDRGWQAAWWLARTHAGRRRPSVE